MSKDKKMIKFDITRGLAYDRNQNEIRQAAAIIRNQVFVPAEFTANYFGLSCYIHPDAAIVRISDSRATFPDVFLAGQFSSKMESMLARQQQNTTAATTTVTTSASSAATTASTTQVTSSSQTAVSQTSASATAVTTTAAPLPPTDVSLCFTGGSLRDVQAVLDWLERNELDACFYIDCTDPGAAAAIVSAGHTLGIRLPDRGTEQALVKAADAANDLLYRSIRMKTRLVFTLAPGNTINIRAHLTNAGYSPAASALRGDRMSAATLEAYLQRGTPNLLLMLECTDETVNLLRSLQSTVRRSGGTLAGYRDAYGG